MLIKVTLIKHSCIHKPAPAYKHILCRTQLMCTTDASRLSQLQNPLARLELTLDLGESHRLIDLAGLLSLANDEQALQVGE